jgi:multiple sugar transport system permease protein/alpha-1,4-digalacturonate transport system permease protein
MAATSLPAAARHRRLPWGRAVSFGVLTLGAVVTLFPVYWILATAVDPHASINELWPPVWSLASFADTWAAFPFGRWFANSWLIASIAVVITVSLNTLAGYTFAKYRFRGRTILFFAILVTLMVPIQVIIVPEFLLVSQLGLLGTIWSVILPRAAEPFGIFMARQFFLSIPDELIEAARIDGAGDLTIFLRIVLPLARPLLAVLTIFTFMYRWNDFSWPLVVLQGVNSFTVTLGLNSMNGNYKVNESGIMAMSLVSIVPMLLVFVVFQRYFVAGIATTGAK